MMFYVLYLFALFYFQLDFEKPPLYLYGVPYAYILNILVFLANAVT